MPIYRSAWSRWKIFHAFSSQRMCIWSRWAILLSASTSVKDPCLHQLGQKNPLHRQPKTDVHLLASRALPSGRYYRVDVGDVEGLVHALRAIEEAVKGENDPDVIDGGLLGRLNPTPALRTNAVNG